jgi:hypothetical protein
LTNYDLDDKYLRLLDKEKNIRELLKKELDFLSILYDKFNISSYFFIELEKNYNISMMNQNKMNF